MEVTVCGFFFYAVYCERTRAVYFNRINKKIINFAKIVLTKLLEEWYNL